MSSKEASTAAAPALRPVAAGPAKPADPVATLKGAPASAPIKPDEVLGDPGNAWRIEPSAVDFEDPLLTALAILAAALERPISAHALKSGLPQAEGRFTPDLVVRAATRIGLSARTVRRAKVTDILPVALPCILLLKNGNAAVLLRFKDGGQAEVALPEAGGGTKSVPVKELQEGYTGYAIFAKPEFRFDNRATEVRLTDRADWFWGTLKRFWPIYSHVVLASFVINCFIVASPLFIMNVYDRVVPNNAVETLWVLALGVITVYAFEFVIRNLRNYFVDVAGKNADVIIASELLRQVMGMRMDAKPPSTGALANNLREFESLRDFFTSGSLVAFVDLPFVLLFILVMWLIAGPIAVVPAVAVPAVIGVGLLLQTPLIRVVEKTYRESAQKHAVLIEAIDGLETIKSAGGEGRVQRMWERFVGMSAESARKARIISTLSTTFSQVAVQMVTVGVVVWGVYQISEGLLTMGALVACTMLVGRALAPLGAIAALVTRFQQSRVALKGLDKLMKSPVERAPEKTFLHRPRLNGEVEFRKVNFKYPTQEGNALDGVSFKVAPGEKVGIIGRVGSGKSTVARMILGLYEPTNGAVMMDGIDIRQLDPADVRRNIGYVSQDNYLFYGTVRDNIAFGAPYVDDATLLRAATIAGVTDFLKSHPHGFDLQVGERGMGLSGGQRQAITLARALLLDPSIILLDEPTSSMDNSSEAAFKRRLGEVLGKKTLVLITHRSSLLPLVDRILILDQGKIVADGPREDVLNALRQGQIRSPAG